MANPAVSFLCYFHTLLDPYVPLGLVYDPFGTVAPVMAPVNLIGGKAPASLHQPDSKKPSGWVGWAGWAGLGGLDGLAGWADWPADSQAGSCSPLRSLSWLLSRWVGAGCCCTACLPTDWPALTEELPVSGCLGVHSLSLTSPSFWH